MFTYNKPYNSAEIPDLFMLFNFLFSLLDLNWTTAAPEEIIQTKNILFGLGTLLQMLMILPSTRHLVADTIA